MIWEVLFGLLILVLVALPPKWDPAIRIKEWLEKERTDDTQD